MFYIYQVKSGHSLPPPPSVNGHSMRPQPSERKQQQQNTGQTWPPRETGEHSTPHLLLSPLGGRACGSHPAAAGLMLTFDLQPPCGSLKGHIQFGSSSSSTAAVAATPDSSPSIPSHLTPDKHHHRLQTPGGPCSAFDLISSAFSLRIIFHLPCGAHLIVATATSTPEGMMAVILLCSLRG